jgi:hypothetical protein
VADSASPKIDSLKDLLTGVAAISASNARTVGTALGAKSFDQTLVMHWNGRAWSRVVRLQHLDRR